MSNNKVSATDDAAYAETLKHIADELGKLAAGMSSAMSNPDEFVPSEDNYLLTLRMEQFKCMLDQVDKRFLSLHQVYGMWLGNRGLRRQIALNDSNE